VERRTGERLARCAFRSAIASRSRDFDSTRNSRRRAIAFERRVKASRDKCAARFTVGDSRGCSKIPARKKFRCSAAETRVLLFQVSLTRHLAKSVPREVVTTNRRLPTSSYIRENRPIRVERKTASTAVANRAYAPTTGAYPFNGKSVILAAYKRRRAGTYACPCVVNTI